MAAQLMAMNGLFSARAVLEDRAGDEFLARAAFAGDEDGRAGRRDLADELVDLLHRGRVADDGLPRLLRVGLGRKRRDLAAMALRDAERLGEQVLEMRDVERLEDVVVGAELHRLDRRLRRAVGGHHDDDLPRVDLPDFLERIEPALLAHADVHHDEVGLRLRAMPDALVARLGAQDVERLLFQQAAEGIVDVLLVVDDEDALAILGRARGKQSWPRGEDEPLAPELMRQLAWTTHGGNERL